MAYRTSAAQGKGPEYLIANPARNELYVQYFEIIGAEGQTIFLVNLLSIDLVKKNVVTNVSYSTVYRGLLFTEWLLLLIVVTVAFMFLIIQECCFKI